MLGHMFHHDREYEWNNDDFGVPKWEVQSGMGFRSFRMRQGFGLKRVFGIVLAVGGLTILLSTAPKWVWYAVTGIALIAAGWILFHHK